MLINNFELGKNNLLKCLWIRINGCLVVVAVSLESVYYLISL